MANCLRAGRKHGVPVIVTDRPNPIGGENDRRPDARDRIRVVRRTVPHSAAPRHDHRRAREVLQRRLRHRRGSDRRADGALAQGDVLRRNRPALGDAVSEHADARDRGRLSGHGAVRGHERLRRARDDEAVRADWRAVGGRRSACGDSSRLPPARRALPAGRCSSRRFRSMRSAACGGCQIHVLDRARVPRRRNARSRCSRKFARRTRRSSNGGSRRTNTSTKSCRSTSSPDRASCGSRSKRACRVEAISDSWREEHRALQREHASRTCCTE